MRTGTPSRSASCLEVLPKNSSAIVPFLYLWCEKIWTRPASSTTPCRRNMKLHASSVKVDGAVYVVCDNVATAPPLIEQLPRTLLPLGTSLTKRTGTGQVRASDSATLPRKTRLNPFTHLPSRVRYLCVALILTRMQTNESKYCHC